MKPDYLDAVDNAGTHPYIEQLVKLTATEREILRQMLDGSFFGQRDNTFYDDETLALLQEDGYSAQVALSKPFIVPDYGLYSPINWGNPGFNWVGRDYFYLSGTAFTLSSGFAHYTAVFMKEKTNLLNVYAFSCRVVYAVCSVNAWFYLHKENVQTLTAGIPISDKRYIVKLTSYQGDLTPYDVVKTAGTIDPDFFGTFTGGVDLTQSNFVSSLVAGMRPFSAGATFTLHLDDIVYHDKQGNSVFT